MTCLYFLRFLSIIGTVLLFGAAWRKAETTPSKDLSAQRQTSTAQKVSTEMPLVLSLTDRLQVNALWCFCHCCSSAFFDDVVYEVLLLIGFRDTFLLNTPWQ